jgi:predicted PurR-regulated permease PerM
VPTLAVFIGVMGGLSAFGFIGLFIGPIVLGLLIALFRLRVELNAAEQAPAAE